jgi:predicted acyl esterase
MVPTRDGMLLNTTLFHLPALKEPGPVLLLRCPLNQARYELQARQFAQAGYYTVTQDFRGRFGSTGSYPLYSGEGQDSYDTIEWIRKQPWSNGKVGMWGHSNPATVTWMTAAEGVPLDAWAVSAGAPDFYQNQYLGGVYILAMARGGYPADLYGPPPAVGHSSEWSKWYLHLPLADLESVTGYKAPWQIGDMLHARKDGYWKRTDAIPLIPRINTPGQQIVGFYDFLCRATVTGFQLMRTRSATSFRGKTSSLSSARGTTARAITKTQRLVKSTAVRRPI